MIDVNAESGLGLQTLPRAPKSLRTARNIREDLLCSVVAAALKRELVAIDDDFFTLGGDSLTATLVLVQVRERLDASMTTRTFFDRRTVKSIVEAIDVTASGFDVEDEPEDAHSGFPAVSLLAPRSARAPDEALAHVTRPDLVRATRKFSGAKSLAPCVIYLSAWVRVIAALGARHFPLVVELGGDIGEAQCWLLNPGSGSSPSAPLHVLQRRLLNAPSGTEPDLQGAGSLFLWRGAQSLATAAAPSRAAAFGLAVVEEPQTRFVLIAAPGVELPKSAAALLRDFTEQLAEQLGMSAGG